MASVFNGALGLEPGFGVILAATLVRNNQMLILELLGKRERRNV